MLFDYAMRNQRGYDTEFIVHTNGKLSFSDIYQDWDAFLLLKALIKTKKPHANTCGFKYLL